MIIKNTLNDVVKFKIGDNDYIRLNPLQECNISLENSKNVLEMVNLSFTDKKKTIISIITSPVWLLVELVTYLYVPNFFSYSWFYDLSHVDEDNVYFFEYDNNKMVVIKSDNVIIKNYGHSRWKSFLVLMSLFLYTVLFYLCVILLIYMFIN